jgi:uncharacterized protein YjbI with pentapeptide repeats
MNVQINIHNLFILLDFNKIKNMFNAHDDVDTYKEYIFYEYDYNEDLSNLNLRGKDFSSKNFSFFNLSNSNLSFADLSGTVFMFSNLSNANFTGVDLTNAVFKRSNLNGVNFTDAILTNTVFNDCNLLDSIFS